MVNLTKALAGLLVVAAVALGVFAWMVARHPAPVPIVHVAPPTYAVVVASHPMRAGVPIAASDLDVSRMPQSPAGGFSDTASLVGRVPVVDIGAGQAIVERALLAGLAGRLEPGERAVAIKVDELAGVGGRVRPGDWVDVFMLLHRDDRSGEITRTQARLLLSKVRVLAYGRSDITQDDAGAAAPASGGAARSRADAQPSNTADANPTSATSRAYAQPSNASAAQNAANDPANAHTAVIALRVEDVDALALADSAGRLVLALRNPGDERVSDDAAFGPSGSVLTQVNGGATPPREPENRAAAGLLLEQLVRDKGAPRNGDTPLPALAPIPRATRVSDTMAPARPRDAGVEIIRGTHRDTTGG
ncbi:Flp pilus assembly protein CpaB [Pararobbsia silviterrae]|uniref:Flp pilus assembly protein CpaB n=1 Tax=Pararobbsia silviterrae TaxID=1792498 RepID=A0A494XQ21_9BURK|nr:Flp pilus assembly protein CpaB [Pararobbsia silviterrae]RKP50259.1 Flp pilus assembly protein CpaB [Pararobbsia silviterrae]